MSWRQHLPHAASRRVAVRVTPDAVRQLRGGSPWLYDGSITSTSHDGSSGDLGVVFDDKRRFVAIGLWDPNSAIRLKVLHTGEPTQIDETFWQRRLLRAIDRREMLAADPSTTGYRLVHGENDGLPGLVADRYDSVLVVKLYSAAWFPHLAPVVDALVSIAQPATVVLRLSRSVAEGNTFGLADGDCLVGSAPTAPVLFLERGLTFEADVVAGQKTGHFLDQRDNRTLVRGLAEGADVLDVFASTGGFAVSAAAGGARSVHLIDLAAPAIATAERNFAHNRHLAAVRACATHTTVGDAFDELDRLGRRALRNADRFDVVVIDPPSFAMNQAGIDRAVRAYSKLSRLGIDVLRPGGTLVQASCSSRVSADQFYDAVHAAAAASGRRMHELRRTGHAVDHPIGFAQGEYLKAIIATVS